MFSLDTWNEGCIPKNLACGFKIKNYFTVYVLEGWKHVFY
jgi:hypothetical protein